MLVNCTITTDEQSFILFNVVVCLPHDSSCLHTPGPTQSECKMINPLIDRSPSPILQVEKQAQSAQSYPGSGSTYGAGNQMYRSTPMLHLRKQPKEDEVTAYRPGI